MKKDELMKFEKEKQQNILRSIMYPMIMESSLTDKKLPLPEITDMFIDLEILDTN